MVHSQQASGLSVHCSHASVPVVEREHLVEGTLKSKKPRGQKDYQRLLVPASGSLQPPGFIRGYHSAPDRMAPQSAQPEPGTRGATD